MGRACTQLTPYRLHRSRGRIALGVLRRQHRSCRVGCSSNEVGHRAAVH